VAVNHVWLRHFGAPLVDNVFDFGLRSDRPRHAALLDWLAVEFVNPTWRAGGRESPGGWSTKHLHQLMVTSSAYRMRSEHRDNRAANTTADPDNRYLWRMNSRRLEAEAVRDGVLFVAGNLDTTAGGPEIPLTEGETSPRRGVYFRHAHERQVKFLELFDAANPCDAYRRTESVLPQQALALTNSELAQRLSRVLAGKLTRSATTDDVFVRAAFEQVLGRPPREDEAAASAKFLARQRELFEASAAELKAAKPQPGGPSADPATRARENLVLALFNHTDFVTVR
jgi:hypothetical protein